MKSPIFYNQESSECVYTSRRFYNPQNILHYVLYLTELSFFEIYLKSLRNKKLSIGKGPFLYLSESDYIIFYAYEFNLKSLSQK